jgi:hypothetical protein
MGAVHSSRFLCYFNVLRSKCTFPSIPKAGPEVTLRHADGALISRHQVIDLLG